MTWSLAGQQPSLATNDDPDVEHYMTSLGSNKFRECFIVHQNTLYMCKLCLGMCYVYIFCYTNNIIQTTTDIKRNRSPELQPPGSIGHMGHFQDFFLHVYATICYVGSELTYFTQQNNRSSPAAYIKINPRYSFSVLITS